MKPIIAIVSMALGTTSMATAGYMALNPNAFLSTTSRVQRHTEMSVAKPIQPKLDTFAPDIVQPIEIAPIRITGRVVTRAKPDLARPTVAASVLSPCSDWRGLGPAATQSASSTSEHQVKLLCPSGANAQETFLARAKR